MRGAKFLSSIDGWQPTPLQRTVFHRCLERPVLDSIYTSISCALRDTLISNTPGKRGHSLQRATRFWGSYFHLDKGREPRLFFATSDVVGDLRVVWLDDDRQLNAFLTIDRSQDFDFATPPLWRMTLLRSDISDVVVWTYHHILIDGPSRATVFQEWLEALSAIECGSLPQFPPMRPPSFAEHLSALEAANTQEARALWREELKGFIGGTPLPPWPTGSRRASTDTACHRRNGNRRPGVSVEPGP